MQQQQLPIGPAETKAIVQREAAAEESESPSSPEERVKRPYCKIEDARRISSSLWYSAF